MRNLEFYNEAASRGAVVKRSEEDDEPRPLPYILVVVDELSDLDDGRAARCGEMPSAGSHRWPGPWGSILAVATQRPSVDVVTGVIKANIPSRFAFSVAVQADSRVILDQGGAENLIGHGDMPFLHANSAKPMRIQGSWVNEKEMAAVVGHCRRQGDPDYIEGVTVEESAASGEGNGRPTGDDEVLQEALEADRPLAAGINVDAATQAARSGSPCGAHHGPAGAARGCGSLTRQQATGRADDRRRARGPHGGVDPRRRSGTSDAFHNGASSSHTTNGRSP